MSCIKNDIKTLENIPWEAIRTTKSGEDYGDYKINIRYVFNCTQLIPCSRSLPIPSFLVYLVNPNLLETWTFWRPANLALARRKASTANWIFSSCQQTGWEDHELGMIFRKLYCIYCKLPIVILVLYEILFAFLRVNTYTYIYIYFMLYCALCCIVWLSFRKKWSRAAQWWSSAWCLRILWVYLQPRSTDQPEISTSTKLKHGKHMKNISWWCIQSHHSLGYTSLVSPSCAGRWGPVQCPRVLLCHKVCQRLHAFHWKDDPHRHNSWVENGGLVYKAKCP